MHCNYNYNTKNSSATQGKESKRVSKRRQETNQVKQHTINTLINLRKHMQSTNDRT